MCGLVAGFGGHHELEVGCHLALGGVHVLHRALGSRAQHRAGVRHLHGHPGHGLHVRRQLGPQSGRAVVVRLAAPAHAVHRQDRHGPARIAGQLPDPVADVDEHLIVRPHLVPLDPHGITVE